MEEIEEFPRIEGPPRRQEMEWPRIPVHPSLGVPEIPRVPPPPQATHEGDRDQIMQALRRMEGLIGRNCEGQGQLESQVQKLNMESAEAFWELKRRMEEMERATNQWQGWATPFEECTKGRLSGLENNVAELLGQLNNWRPLVEEKVEEQEKQLDLLHAKLLGTITLLDNERKIRAEQGTEILERLRRQPRKILEESQQVSEQIATKLVGHLQRNAEKELDEFRHELAQVRLDSRTNLQIQHESHVKEMVVVHKALNALQLGQGEACQNITEQAKKMLQVSNQWRKSMEGKLGEMLANVEKLRKDMEALASNKSVEELNTRVGQALSQLESQMKFAHQGLKELERQMRDLKAPKEGRISSEATQGTWQGPGKVVEKSKLGRPFVETARSGPDGPRRNLGKPKAQDDFFLDTVRMGKAGRGRDLGKPKAQDDLYLGTAIGKALQGKAPMEKLCLRETLKATLWDKGVMRGKDPRESEFRLGETTAADTFATRSVKCVTPALCRMIPRVKPQPHAVQRTMTPVKKVGMSSPLYGKQRVAQRSGIRVVHPVNFALHGRHVFKGVTFAKGTAPTLSNVCMVTAIEEECIEGSNFVVHRVSKVNMVEEDLGMQEGMEEEIFLDENEQAGQGADFVPEDPRFDVEMDPEDVNVGQNPFGRVPHAPVASLAQGGMNLITFFYGNVPKPKFSGRPGAWWSFKRDWEQFVSMGSNVLGRMPDDRVLLDALRESLDPTSRLELMHELETRGSNVSYREFWVHLKEKYERDTVMQTRRSWQQLSLNLQDGEYLTWTVWRNFVAAYKVKAARCPDKTLIEERMKVLGELPRKWREEIVREENRRRGQRRCCKIWGRDLELETVGRLLTQLQPLMGQTIVHGKEDCFNVECFGNLAQRELLDHDGEMYEGVCLRVQPSEVKMSIDAIFQFVEERLRLEEEIRQVERSHMPFNPRSQLFQPTFRKQWSNQWNNPKKVHAVVEQVEGSSSSTEGVRPRKGGKGMPQKGPGYASGRGKPSWKQPIQAPPRPNQWKGGKPSSKGGCGQPYTFKPVEPTKGTQGRFPPCPHCLRYRNKEFTNHKAVDCRWNPNNWQGGKSSDWRNCPVGSGGRGKGKGQ